MTCYRSALSKNANRGQQHVFLNVQFTNVNLDLLENHKYGDQKNRFIDAINKSFDASLLRNGLLGITYDDAIANK